MDDPKAGSLHIHMTTKHAGTGPGAKSASTNGFVEASPRSAASGSTSTGVGLASPPPLKVGNHYALAPKASPASSGPAPSVTTTVTPSPSLLSNDIRELKEVLREIRSTGNPAQIVGAPNSNMPAKDSQGSSINHVISAKLESLLLSLDTRVGRLEKQVESSVNSLYSLVQLQSSMNTAFSRFREDISGQLRSLQNLITLASTSIANASSA